MDTTSPAAPAEPQAAPPHTPADTPTGAPLATGDGQPSAADPTPAGAGPATTVPQPLATPPTPQAGPAEPDTPEAQGKIPQVQGEFDPDRAMRTIAALRARETELSKELREQRKHYEEFTAGLAKLIGLGEEEPPDPEVLTQQLSSAQAETRQARVELAVYRAAAQHGADPDAVLDSRSFQAAVADLDPSAPDFETRVNTALAAAVQTNPRLRAAPPPPPQPAAPAQNTPQAPAGVSGAPITGATETGPITEAQLAEAYARGDTAQITKWLREGRLTHLL